MDTEPMDTEPIATEPEEELKMDKDKTYDVAEAVDGAIFGPHSGSSSIVSNIAVEEANNNVMKINPALSDFEDND